MAVAGVQLPADWGYIPLAFGAGLLWRQPVPAVHLHCPVVEEAAAVAAAGGGFSWWAIALAVGLGLCLSRVFCLGAALPRARQVRALFAEPRARPVGWGEGF